jgi:ubiquinone/menaquinone biosynthesis C-methylase UbiE
LTFLTPPRADAPELLDMGFGTPEDVQRSMNDLWRVNTYLGGKWTITRHLYPRLACGMTVVDLGAGDAQIAAAVTRWAHQNDKTITVVPLDFSRRHMTNATGDAMYLLQADALCLPFAPGGVDYVMSSLFLHHFSPQQVISILCQSFKVARRGIIMSDLVRGHFNEFAWHVARPVFARSHITYHDGLASIKRAYTPDELLSLAREAGIRNAKLYAPFPWRMTLVADKGAPHDDS